MCITRYYYEPLFAPNEPFKRKEIPRGTEKDRNEALSDDWKQRRYRRVHRTSATRWDCDPCRETRSRSWGAKQSPDSHVSARGGWASFVPEQWYAVSSRMSETPKCPNDRSVNQLKLIRRCGGQNATSLEGLDAKHGAARPAPTRSKRKVILQPKQRGRNRSSNKRRTNSGWIIGIQSYSGRGGGVGRYLFFLVQGGRETRLRLFDWPIAAVTTLLYQKRNSKKTGNSL